MPLIDLGVPILALIVSAFNLVQYGRYAWDIRQWPYILLASVPLICLLTTVVQVMNFLQLERPTVHCRWACVAPMLGILLVEVLQALVILVKMPKGTLWRRYPKRR